MRLNIDTQDKKYLMKAILNKLHLQVLGQRNYQTAEAVESALRELNDNKNTCILLN